MNNFTPHLISRNFSYINHPPISNKTTINNNFNDPTSNGGILPKQQSSIIKSSSLANYKLNIPLPHNKQSSHISSTIPSVTLTTSSSLTKMKAVNSLKEMNRTFLEKTKSDFNDSLHKCYSNISQIHTKIQRLSNNNTICNSNSNAINNNSDSKLLNEENENVRISNSILARTNVDLMNQIKEMNSLSDSMNKINELIKEKEELQSKLNEYKKENKNLKTITEGFQNKLNVLTNDNTVLTNKLLEMNMIVQTKQTYTDDVKSNCDKQVMEITNVNKELQNELKHNKKEIANLNMKILSYEKAFSNMKTNLKQKDDTKELQTLKETLIQNQSSKIKELQNELSSKTKELNDVNEKYDLLNKTLHNVKQIIKEQLLQKQSQYSYTQYKSFLNKIKCLLYGNDNESEIEELKQTIEELTNENKNLQAQITTTTLNYDNEITMRNKQLLLLHDENIALKNECTSHNQKVNSLLKNSSTQIDQTLSYSNTTSSSQSLYLFRIYDNTRIICFDLTSHEYQIIEYIDNSNFGLNYVKNGSIYLNTLTGVFILTNKNYDTLYYYNYSTNSISYITTFQYNHSHGALVFDSSNNTIYAISGWYNTKVEKYTNNNISLYIYEDTFISNSNSNENLQNVKDIQYNRSESGILFMNGIIYMFFGYSYIKSEYVNSIEYYNTNKEHDGWKVMDYTSIGRNFLLKENAVVPINEDEVFLLGGYDGVNGTFIENLIVFNFKYKTIREEKKKLPDIVDSKCYYGFGKESFFISYTDNENGNYNSINSNNDKKIIMGNIDDNVNVHLIQLGTLRYDLFKFD